MNVHFAIVTKITKFQIRNEENKYRKKINDRQKETQTGKSRQKKEMTERKGEKNEK